LQQLSAAGGDVGAVIESYIEKLFYWSCVLLPVSFIIASSFCNNTVVAFISGHLFV